MASTQYQHTNLKYLTPTRIQHGNLHSHLSTILHIKISGFSLHCKNYNLKLFFVNTYSKTVANIAKLMKFNHLPYGGQYIRKSVIRLGFKLENRTWIPI